MRVEADAVLPAQAHGTGIRALGGSAGDAGGGWERDEEVAGTAGSGGVFVGAVDGSDACVDGVAKDIRVRLGVVVPFLLLRRKTLSRSTLPNEASLSLLPLSSPRNPTMRSKLRLLNDTSRSEEHTSELQS